MTAPVTPALRRFLLLGGGLLLGSLAQAQTLDPTFQPPRIYSTSLGPRTAGTVNDVVQQPDGKYLIGGLFSEVNGVAVGNLARLNADGTLDASFVTSGTNTTVTDLALQPDGKILVAGGFQTLGGATRRAIGRLNADGSLDTAFNPPTTGAQNGNFVNSISVQPDGRILVGGSIFVRGAGVGPQYLDRLDGSTGQPDAGFQPYQPTGTAANGGVSTHLLLPTGKIVTGGIMYASYVQGTLLQGFNADGTPDASFAKLDNFYISGIKQLSLDAAGRLYAAGSYNSAPNGGNYVRRLLADGSTDITFNYRGNNQITEVRTLAVQPNGRLLTANTSIERLMPDGSPDASFSPANGPNAGGSINRLLVQPDGAIVAAGSFTQAGTTAVTGLVRLTAANVLRVRSAAADTRLAAWPVPAHDELNLRLDAAAHSVQLLDALGRTVRTVARPAAEQRLALTDLPAGTYQLCITFADGSQATRRVVVR